MKNYILSFMLLTLVFACRKEDNDTVNTDGQVLQVNSRPVPVPSGDPFSEEEVRNKVLNAQEQEEGFRWTNADVKMIWSGARLTRLVAVGYKPASYRESENYLHNVDITSGEWKEVHDALIEMVLSSLKQQGIEKTAAEIIYEDDPVLPVIIFRIEDKYTITRLYNLRNTRYLEPYGYWPYQDNRSTTGCNGSTVTVNSADYTTITPGAAVPWNYNNLNIPAAWNTAAGAGIKIGVIDAGLSNLQFLLGNQFASGYSSGNRQVSVDYTFGSSAYSACTHGTSMSGLAAGPRTATGAPSGVAYLADLHFIRGCEDVVLDKSSELSGVRNALVRMGNDAAIDIISMSIGTPFYSSTLLDGVSFAYGKGKMLFAAAGTSYSLTSWWGVIYPAAYSQCIAVTGVKENGKKCSSCHDGSQVKFTIPMERDVDNSRHTLSLQYSGTNPGYIGGSSCATATCAGIAAIVWSSRPALTRAQVLDCLRQTAQYPVPVTNKGHGNPNAAAAITMALPS